MTKNNNTGSQARRPARIIMIRAIRNYGAAVLMSQKYFGRSAPLDPDPEMAQGVNEERIESALELDKPLKLEGTGADGDDIVDGDDPRKGWHVWTGLLLRDLRDEGYEMVFADMKTYHNFGPDKRPDGTYRYVAKVVYLSPWELRRLRNSRDQADRDEAHAIVNPRLREKVEGLLRGTMRFLRAHLNPDGTQSVYIPDAKNGPRSMTPPVSQIRLGVRAVYSESAAPEVVKMEVDRIERLKKEAERNRQNNGGSKTANPAATSSRPVSREPEIPANVGRRR